VGAKAKSKPWVEFSIQGLLLGICQFAKEGADVAIIYLNEHDDAKETKQLGEKQGRRAVAIQWQRSSQRLNKEVKN
jgi:hypothetical protein